MQYNGSYQPDSAELSLLCIDCISNINHVNHGNCIMSVPICWLKWTSLSRMDKLGSCFSIKLKVNVKKGLFWLIGYNLWTFRHTFHFTKQCIKYNFHHCHVCLPTSASALLALPSFTLFTPSHHFTLKDYNNPITLWYCTLRNYFIFWVNSFCSIWTHHHSHKLSKLQKVLEETYISV